MTSEEISDAVVFIRMLLFDRTIDNPLRWHASDLDAVKIRARLAPEERELVEFIEP